MKRLIAVGAIAAAVTFGFGGSAGAADDHAPQNDPSAHPHHRHTPDGECHDLEGPDFGGEHGGRHWGARQGEQIHHGSCAVHDAS